MSSKNGSLVVLPPESMSLDSLCEWIKNRASASAHKCGEAEDYYKALKGYHQNIAKLMQRLTELKSTPVQGGDELGEELQSIAEATVEILEAMESLRLDNNLLSESAEDIENVERRMIRSQDGALAKAQVEQEAEVFLKNYRSIKAKLGLHTQQDVAELTGIDRRYISIIENGKHRPQFKTIKKIADAFGVDVSKLTENA
jgi:DNA-binding XRE family transcriptional regulator